MNSLGDRMKSYEASWGIKLPPRQPVIIRVDGKAFHTFTRKFEKPFDQRFITAMARTAKRLCEECEGAQLAYSQSDEISILLVNYKTFTTQSWFDNKIQKLVSVSASIATNEFINQMKDYIGFEKCKKIAFDSRAFCLPKEEVANYFVWRQQDWERNSIQMLGLAHFSHKQLHKLNCTKIKEKLAYYEETPNWENLPAHLRRGIFVRKESESNVKYLKHGWNFDMDPPLVKENREYIEDLVYFTEQN